MRGVVTSVDPATRTNRTAKMTVSFDQVTVNGRAYRHSRHRHAGDPGRRHQG